MSSTDPGRSAQGAAARLPEPALPYTAIQRLADTAAGRRDGRSDARAAAGPAAAGPTAAAAWLERNLRTYQERCRREQLAAADARAPLAAEAARLQAAAGSAAEAAAAAGCMAGPATADLNARHPGEEWDDPAAVAARRQREHAAARNKASAAAASATTGAAALADQAAAAAQALQQFQEDARIRLHWLQRHHERRAAHYLRAYTRAVNRRDAALAPGLVREGAAALPEPEPLD